MHTPIANALKDILSHLARHNPEFAAAPFQGSKLVLQMPNYETDIGVAEAIARYDASVRKVCTELAKHPLGTAADIPGNAFFLSPIVGCAVPSHRPVITCTVGPAPQPVDEFENLGVVDLHYLAERAEKWLEAPAFFKVDLDAEIETAIKDVGDALFAAAA